MLSQVIRAMEYSRSRRTYFVALALGLGLLFIPVQSCANELKEQTLAVWDDYISSACSATELRANQAAFLRLNQIPQGRTRLREGETLVWRQERANPLRVPHGIIHDWIGAVFIPDVTMDDVLAVARDYDHYSEIYAPAVVEAKALASSGNRDEFFMLLRQKVLFVTAALKGEYQTEYFKVNSTRWYSISRSMRLQAIENFGQENMRLLAPDRGPGYVWRLYSVTKFEQADGGVYVELEAIGLSRDVPALFRWMLDPILERLPRSSIQATLDQTRRAVFSRMNQSEITRHQTSPPETTQSPISRPDVSRELSLTSHRRAF